jgi:hypothetical protein
MDRKDPEVLKAINGAELVGAKRALEHVVRLLDGEDVPRVFGYPDRVFQRIRQRLKDLRKSASG